MQRHKLLLMTILIAFLAAPSHSFGRKWVDSTGEKTVEATFIRMKNDIVTMRKTDGTFATVPLKFFCKEDQDYIWLTTPQSSEEASHTTSQSQVNVSAAVVHQPTPSQVKISAESHELTEAELVGTIAVIAEGTGASPDEAIKDAFRNAVRQVVGAVVDAETVIKNDDLISDKVLTYSDGFIKHYDDVPGSKKIQGTIHRIKMNLRQHLWVQIGQFSGGAEVDL